MLMNDHYTPASVAESLIAFSQLRAPKSVADFCVGDGSLIDAACRRWPDIDVFFSDIDPLAIAASKARFPRADAAHYDFLASKGVRPTEALNRKPFDLVLLNPPFSNRGNTRFTPVGVFQQLRCSQSMAFLLSAVQCVGKDGELLCLLPASTLHSETDAEARAVLAQSCEFEVLSEPTVGTFPRVDATIYAARISRIEIPERYSARALIDEPEPELSTKFTIRRGRVSIKRKDRVACTEPFSVVHTTSIRNGRIVETYQKPLCGPTRTSVCLKDCVLVPRVGRFKPGGIAVVKSGSELTLSDCLFAIECPDFSSAERLQASLVENFSALTQSYIGTGAPYISMRRLEFFLADQTSTASSAK